LFSPLPPGFDLIWQNPIQFKVLSARFYPHLLNYRNVVLFRETNPAKSRQPPATTADVQQKTKVAACRVKAWRRRKESQTFRLTGGFLFRDSSPRLLLSTSRRTMFSTSSVQSRKLSGFDATELFPDFVRRGNHHTLAP
jgi:hypothetical protein